VYHSEKLSLFFTVIPFVSFFAIDVGRTKDFIKVWHLENQI